MTWTTTIEKSRKIRLPDELFENKAFKTGQKVRIEELPNGSLHIRFGYELEDMVGILDSNGIHATIEQINDAIAEAGAEAGLGRHDRS